MVTTIIKSVSCLCSSPWPWPWPWPWPCSYHMPVSKSEPSDIHGHGHGHGAFILSIQSRECLAHDCALCYCSVTITVTVTVTGHGHGVFILATSSKGKWTVTVTVTWMSWSPMMSTLFKSKGDDQQMKHGKYSEASMFRVTRTDDFSASWHLIHNFFFMTYDLSFY